MHPNRIKIKQSKIRLFPTTTARKEKTSISKQEIRPVPSLPPKKKKVRITTSSAETESESGRYQPIEKWAGILEGHVAFLLGNAPSIGKLKLDVLDSYLTIGINRIFYIYDPTILMWQDRQLWSRDKKGIERQRAIKVSSASSDPKNLYCHFKVSGSHFKFTYAPHQLYGRGNTGVLSAQFAVALGCTNLVLLGMDCKYGPDGRTDFYGKNKDHKPYTLKMCYAAMRWLRDNCPVPIHNCSNIDLWPQKSLNDVIKELSPRKMSRSDYHKVLLK